MAERVSENPKYGQLPYPCVFCDKPTAFGSGLFVNRVPASGEVELDDGTVEMRDGYACALCAEEVGYQTPDGYYCCECGDERRERWESDGENDADWPEPVWWEDVEGVAGPIVCRDCGDQIKT
jgi:hypothetical protein